MAESAAVVRVLCEAGRGAGGQASVCGVKRREGRASRNSGDGRGGEGREARGLGCAYTPANKRNAHICYASSATSAAQLEAAAPV